MRSALAGNCYRPKAKSRTFDPEAAQSRRLAAGAQRGKLINAAASDNLEAMDHTR
jgi:hypothetical protein